MTKDDLDLDDLFTSRSRRGRQRTPGSPAKDSARLQSAQHERGTGETFTPQVVTGETVTGATDIGEPDTPRGPTSTPRKADSKMTSSTASARQARRGGPRHRLANGGRTGSGELPTTSTSSSSTSSISTARRPAPTRAKWCAKRSAPIWAAGDNRNGCSGNRYPFREQPFLPKPSRKGPGGSARRASKGSAGRLTLRDTGGRRRTGGPDRSTTLGVPHWGILFLNGR